MNNPVDITYASRGATASRLADAVEKVHEAKYLSQAVWMAGASLNRDDCNAVQAVAAMTLDALAEALELLDEVKP
ncbi:hypothetical protein HB779_02145 [Phyllobacterium sp. 628]|uniref:hypothetical protein n=1 Tax=Phyllobacterium sp. 628 TaxID=2718938 RepID=UPI0016621D4C|nr:hypothetical protein [Phyllobacterium sp. 628]QND50822.1 hypothetical protein HB779_02145 [Phyllobacterium sp. 628]